MTPFDYEVAGTVVALCALYALVRWIRGPLPPKPPAEEPEAGQESPKGE